MIILFDMDGTIVYAPERNHLAIKKAFETFGYEVPLNVIKEQFRFTEDPIYRIKRILPEITDDIALEIRHKMSDNFYSLYKLSRLIPGTKEILSMLYKTHTLVLVTSRSNHEATIKELEYLGIKQYFKNIVTAGLLYDPKTSFLADFTEQRKQLLKLAIDGINDDGHLVVGDRRKELEAGKLLGFITVGVLSGVGTESELKDVANYIIKSINYLPKIVKIKEKSYI